MQYDEAERRKEMAMNSLEKYTHYYERWAANEQVGPASAGILLDPMLVLAASGDCLLVPVISLQGDSQPAALVTWDARVPSLLFLDLPMQRAF